MYVGSLQSIPREIPSDVKLGVTQGDIAGTSDLFSTNLFKYFFTNSKKIHPKNLPRVPLGIFSLSRKYLQESP